MDTMIFNDTIYKFEFSDKAEKQMEELGVSYKEIKSAFFEIKDQKEYFSNLAVNSNGSFTFDTVNGHTIVVEKEKNVLKILFIQ